MSPKVIMFILNEQVKVFHSPQALLEVATYYNIAECLTVDQQYSSYRVICMKHTPLKGVNIATRSFVMPVINSLDCFCG